VIPLYHKPDIRAAQLEAFTPWCQFFAADQPPKIKQPTLWYDHAGLSLLVIGNGHPFRVDESSLVKRNPSRGGKVQALSGLGKACGVASTPTVLDAFGGFGFDGLSLSLLGCEVTIFERERIVWLLLSEFVKRTGLGVATHCREAMSFLRTNERHWDVIYLDPMFPQRQKKALPNRGMQLLQNLVGANDLDLEECLQMSKHRARQRVVLKRRAKDEIIGHPSHQILGRSIRFDVYML